MQHKLLVRYLTALEQTIDDCKLADVEQYFKEFSTPDRVNLRIRIRFSQGHLLAINEAVKVVNGQLVWLDYRYHCQDSQNFLYFRYDCTPHFPNLPTCPHHKHLPNDVVASEKPSLLEVIAEAQEVMN